METGAAANTCSQALDQSLTRLGLPYVDIFYHHRMDPETPLEETMGALDQAVKSEKELSMQDFPTTMDKKCRKPLRSCAI